MTKEEFEALQLDLEQSGKSLKLYLQEVGVSFNLQLPRKKYASDAKPKGELAPISFTRPAAPVFTDVVPSGATLLFPNGLRSHFDSGTGGVLMELLNKSLDSHVLS